MTSGVSAGKVERSTSRCSCSTLRFVPRRSHEQDHAVDAAVAPLGLAATLRRLDVVQVGLGIDADRAGTIQLHIPRPQIPGSADEHFGAPPEHRMQSLAEAPDQPELAAIPNRRALRIRLQAEAQPERGAVDGQLVQAWRQALRPFGAADTRLVQPGDVGHVLLAEACRQPGIAQLEADLPEQLASLSPTPEAGSIGCRHGSTMPAAPWPGLHPRCARPAPALRSRCAAASLALCCRVAAACPGPGPETA